METCRYFQKNNNLLATNARILLFVLAKLRKRNKMRHYEVTSNVPQRPTTSHNVPQRPTTRKSKSALKRSKQSRRTFLQQSGAAVAFLPGISYTQQPIEPSPSGPMEYCFWVKYDPKDMAKSDPASSSEPAPEQPTQTVDHYTPAAGDQGPVFRATYQEKADPAGAGDWLIDIVFSGIGPKKTVKPTGAQAGLSTVSFTPRIEVNAYDTGFTSGGALLFDKTGKKVTLKLKANAQGEQTGEYEVEFDGSTYSETAIAAKLAHREVDSQTASGANGTVHAISDLCFTGWDTQLSFDGTQFSVSVYGTIGGGTSASNAAPSIEKPPLRWKVIMLKRLKGTTDEWQEHKTIEPIGSQKN